VLTSIREPMMILAPKLRRMTKGGDYHEGHLTIQLRKMEKGVMIGEKTLDLVHSGG